MKFRTPVTVHNGREYVPPGTEIDSEEIGMSDRELKSFFDRHGEYGGANLPQDPGNTQVLNVLDAASIEGLNVAALIHGGHGKDAVTLIEQHRRENPQGNQQAVTAGAASLSDDVEQLPSDAELEAMKKDDLIDLAEKRGVALEHGATKADIIAALKAK